MRGRKVGNTMGQVELRCTYKGGTVSVSALCAVAPPRLAYDRKNFDVQSLGLTDSGTGKHVGINLVCKGPRGLLP